MMTRQRTGRQPSPRGAGWALPDSARERLKALRLELDEYLDRLERYPEFFVDELWRDRVLYAHSPLNEIDFDMVRFAAGDPDPDTGLMRLPNRRALLAPRGIGKTTQVTAALTAWDQYRTNGEATNLIPSKSEKAAKQMLAQVRQWITDVWFLRHLEPDLKKDHRDAATMFDTGPRIKSKNPAVAAYGIEGQLEGARASRTFPDDVETKDNTKTREAREELDRRVKEFSSITSFGERDICFVGTVHHEETLYAKLAKRGYLVRTYPELYPTEDEHIMGLAPTLKERLDRGLNQPGDIVFSHRRDQRYVLEQQAEGRSHFAMQHQCVANLGDVLRYPLRLADFIVHPVQRDKAPLTIAWGLTGPRGQSTRIDSIPSLGFDRDGFHGPIMFDEDWSTYLGTKMWIDPSGRGADKTAYAIVAQLNGFLWVKAVGAFAGGYSPETLDGLARAARQHMATDIYVEANFGQDMFSVLLEPALHRNFVEPGDSQEFPAGWRASITSRFSKGQKEVRIIEALEPVLNTHRLVIDPAVAANEDLQRQITRITRDRNSLPHEDEIEALAACVNEWKLSLAQDPDKAAERQRDRWIEDAIREQNRLAGFSTPEPCWISKH